MPFLNSSETIRRAARNFRIPADRVPEIENGSPSQPALRYHPKAMIIGTHAIIYAQDADRVRHFFREILGFTTADAGHGWLLFALPPAELGVHPADGGPHHELYLMCDDLAATIDHLKRNGIDCGEVHDAPWGSVTTIHIPGGATMGLYEPRHPTAIKPLTARTAAARKAKPAARAKRAAKPRKTTRKRKR